MGLDTFVKVLLRNWWLILLTVVVTAGSTWFFASGQKPVYQAVTTVELKPSTKLDTPQIIVSVYNSLDNRIKINTIARKATSGSMLQRVAAKLNVALPSVRATDVSTIVIPQSNLIEIRSQSTNPEFAAAVVNTTAQELQTESLRDVMEIEVIDVAVPSTTPIGRGLNYLLTMAVLFGLALGAIFALLEYFIGQMRLSSRSLGTPVMQLAGAAVAADEGAAEGSVGDGTGNQGTNRRSTRR